MSDRRCGLYGIQGTAYPIRNVDVHVTVLQDFCCQVNLTQTFQVSTKKKTFNPSQCKGGHGLNENTVRHPRNCMGCGKRVYNGNLMFGCETCDYHLCGSCHIPIRKCVKNCPGNHGLKPAVAEKNRIVCDVCDTSVPGGKTIYKCKECFYDLCEKCYDPNAAAAAKPKNFIASSYYFPLDGNAAVYDFKATLEDGTVVQGDCRTKNKAEKMYQNAISQGKQAFLMKQDKSDIFNISLGNVAEDEEVKIEISYVAELEMDGGKIRVRIPNRIAPKCGGGPSTDVTYPINFDFALRMSTPITEIKALGGYDLSIKNTPGDENFKRVEICREGFMNDDLVLLISQQNPYGVYSTLERSALFNSDILRTTFNKDDGNTTQMPGKADVIILVDKSGSMSGSRMKTTKKALSMFLRSLPVDSYFNIIAFDYNVRKAFTNSVMYNESNMEKAQNFCDNLNAQGGTDIKTPLANALKSPEHKGYQKSIILLTDGEVNNTDACINLVQNTGIRVFTLGIGTSFSQEIVEGLATATGATWEAVRDTKDIGGKVMRTLGCVLKPYISKFEYDLGEFGQNNDLVMWPTEIPKIYDGKRATIYWIRSSEKSLNLPSAFDVKLKGEYDNGNTLNMTLKVLTCDGEGIQEEMLKRNRLSCDGLVHRVAALSRIRKLERSKGDFSSEIRRLGMKYKLSSSQTSFVAIRKGDPVNVKREAPQEFKSYPSRSFGARNTNYSMNSMSLGMSAPRSMKFGSLGSAPRRNRQRRVPSTLRSSKSSSRGGRGTVKSVQAAPQAPSLMSFCASPPVTRGMAHAAPQQEMDLFGMTQLEPNKKEVAHFHRRRTIGRREMLPVQDEEKEATMAKLLESMNDENSEDELIVTLDWLIRQQKFSGNFSFSIDNYEIVNSFENGIAKLKSAGVVDREILATLIAIVLLHKNFAAQKAEWTLLEAKAKQWVSRKISMKLEDALSLLQ